MFTGDCQNLFFFFHCWRVHLVEVAEKKGKKGHRLDSLASRAGICVRHVCHQKWCVGDLPVSVSDTYVTKNGVSVQPSLYEASPVQNTIMHNVTVFIVIVNNNLIQYKSNCMNCGQKPMARLGIF